MAHRLVLKPVNVSWAKYLETHANADAKMAELFEAMHNARDEYASNPERFWQTVKSNVSWALFLNISEIYDLAESMVIAARNFLDMLEDEGRPRAIPRKKLPQLVHEWVEWHDALRRQSRSVSVALSFVPDRFPPAGRRRLSISTLYEDADEESVEDSDEYCAHNNGKSLSPDSPQPIQEEASDTLCNTASHTDKRPNEAQVPISTGASQPFTKGSETNPVISTARESNVPDYRPRAYSNSHTSVTAPGSPLPSSVRLARILTEDHQQIIQSVETGSPTNPLTYAYRGRADSLTGPGYPVVLRRRRLPSSYPTQPNYNLRARRSLGATTGGNRIQKSTAVSTAVPKSVAQIVSRVGAAASAGGQTESAADNQGDKPSESLDGDIPRAVLRGGWTTSLTLRPRRQITRPRSPTRRQK
ncbi:hypothetical protein JX266_005885 [Neoarthrinium moseri]|nr:hypothetical protein JX266_005885 [Neoarthrinium moseri]